MPLIILILLVLVLLESTLVSIPLVLIFLICLVVLRKDRAAFILSFIGGIMLDMLLIRNIGSSALVMVTIVFLIMLYQRKFEIASYYFVGIASLIASLIYVFIFHISHPFFHATLSAVLAILFFSILLRIFAKKEKPLSTV